VTHLSPIRVIRALAVVGAIFTTSAISSASSAGFTVYNDGTVTIEHLYVSPHGRNSWDADLLGTYVLNPGYNFHPLENYTVPTCWQDIKAVYEDGHVITDWDVDICSVNIHYSY